MAMEIGAAAEASDGGAKRPARRRWERPRVIVTTMSGTEHNLLAFIYDHTQLGGSSSGTANS
jgi:hypothetical protein